MADGQRLRSGHARHDRRRARHRIGKLEITPFVWSGNNSEIERRQAGKKPLHPHALEAKGEPYCIVGHSYGGSVVSWALLESAARRL
ncbi:MAG: hypothetical protein R3D67_03340 [Hyphomicrobiaceae bacterium]